MISLSSSLPNKLEPTNPTPNAPARSLPLPPSLLVSFVTNLPALLVALEPTVAPAVAAPAAFLPILLAEDLTVALPRVRPFPAPLRVLDFLPLPLRPLPPISKSLPKPPEPLIASMTSFSLSTISIFMFSTAVVVLSAASVGFVEGSTEPSALLLLKAPPNHFFIPLGTYFPIRL